ncbi:extracellular solute-binding protein [Bosea sp. 2RAB26]|uniref:extracellular solute-binding protein n=1 Tax=Bosea sp. 2RAB26 TaxID=3237476 RepID=UPI003F929EEC
MKHYFRLAVAALALASAPGIALAQSKQLLLYSWANYVPPDLLKRFEAETGVKVSVDVYDSNDTMLAKLQAGGGGYDIVVPTNSVLATMIRSNLLQKIDAAKLANFGNVKAPHDRPDADPGREYSVPYLWGSTGFTYDSAKVPGGKLAESWKEFFEPRPDLVGKIAALNDQGEMFSAAAIYLGLDTCTENPADAQRILELLAKQKPSVKIYSSTGTIDRVAAGEVALHQQWNGASHRARAKLPTAVFVYPTEGMNLWGDNFAVPKGAANPENAKLFLNWMMDPRNAAEASNFSGYNNAIKGSDAFMTAELRDNPAINPPEALMTRFRPVKDCSLKARELRDGVWTRLRR